MEVEKEVIELIAKISKTPTDEIAPTDRLTKDLGFDSLDVVELTMDCEQKFQIAVPEWESIRVYTVNDVIEVVTEHMDILRKIRN